MAKPQPARNRANSPNSSTAAAAPPAQDLVLPDFFSNYKLQGFVIFALACMLYIGTLGHQFTQDDAIVITDNMFTQQGTGGIGGILSKDTFFGFFKVEGKAQLVSGGRYRPFTLVLFAFIFEIAGKNPFVFHLFTVLLYGATCLMLYHTLRTMMATRFGQGYALLVAWIASILFAVHPIHTEAVANIKGCDEIATLLGSLATLYLLFKAYDTGESKWSWIAGGVYFLACMSKENAVTFLAVAPLALYVFRDTDFGKALGKTAPMWVAFFLFFMIRSSILGWKFGGAPLELMNNPYIKWVGNGWQHFNPAEKFATIFYTLGKYIMLLIFPHPLTHDYYPNHISAKSFGDPAVLGSLVLYGALAYYGFRGAQKRQIIGFGILFYLLTLSIVSNLVFPIGTHMGERFAFMPSVGFCLVVAVGLVQLLRTAQGWNVGNLALPLGLTAAVALAFSAKTFLRIPAWETNDKLFFTDVKTSFKSAKISNACGGTMLDRAIAEKEDEAKRKQYAQEAIPHLDKALDTYRDYSDAYISRGGAHLLAGNLEKSVADYRMAVQLQPDKASSREALATALREAGKQAGEKRGDLAGALKYLSEAWQMNPKESETARLLGVASGISQNHAEAIKWFTKATELDPKNAVNFFDLGTAYQISGNAAKAQELYAKAQQIDPDIMNKKRR